MQLAVNYSTNAAALLQTGVIEFDFYKCSGPGEALDAAHRQRPAFVHFPLRAGSGTLKHTDWTQLEQTLATTCTAYINVHLAPFAMDFPGIPVDTQDPAWVEVVLERVLGDIHLLTSRFGADRVIVENALWDPTPSHIIPSLAIEPAIISRIVREARCGFLLDVAHARISAMHLGMDVYEYISALPVDRLREVHITGVLYMEMIRAWRDHFPMTEEDWTISAWVLERIGRGLLPRPQIVALEYGGTGPKFDWRSHPDVLVREVPRLRLLLMLAAASASSVNTFVPVISRSA